MLTKERENEPIDWPPDQVAKLRDLIAWLATRPPSDLFRAIYELSKVHLP